MIVGVIGSGAIGPDLAYGFLSALAAGEGGKVYLLDIKKEALDAGTGRIEGYVKKALSRGRMSPKVAEAVRAALVPTMDIKDLADTAVGNGVRLALIVHITDVHNLGKVAPDA